MRVLVVGLRGIGPLQGGIEAHATNLYPRLAKLGWEVELVARSAYLDRGAAREWPAIKITSLWSPRTKHSEAAIHTLLAVLYAGITRPDLLHVHAIGPALWVPLAKVLLLKVVVTHHGPDYVRHKWGWLAKAVLRVGEWVGMRFADERIAVSKTIAQLIQTSYGRSAVVIPNGVQRPQAQLTLETTGAFGLHPQRYFLLVSRLVPEKRHLDLIRAFESTGISGWKLVLVGDADHADSYRQAVVSEARRVRDVVLTGFQSGQALHELFGNAGAFVLPSAHEGLPIALLEALSYRLPVAASDIDAHRELGLPPHCYFPVGDVAALARILQTVARDTAGWMGGDWQPARFLEAFDWDAVAACTVAVYDKIAPGR